MEGAVINVLVEVAARVAVVVAVPVGAAAVDVDFGAVDVVGAAVVVVPVGAAAVTVDMGVDDVGLGAVDVGAAVGAAAAVVVALFTEPVASDVRGTVDVTVPALLSTVFVPRLAAIVAVLTLSVGLALRTVFVVPFVTAAAVFSVVRVTDVVASDTRGEADTTPFTVLGAPLAALLTVLTVSVNGLALRTVFVVPFVAVSTVLEALFVTAAAVFSVVRVSGVVAPLATLVAVPTVSRAVFVAAFVAVAAVRAPPPVTAAAVFSAVRVTDVVASDTVRGEADTTPFTVLGAPLAALLAVLTVSVNGLALRAVFVVPFVAVSTVREAPFATAAAVFSIVRVSDVVAPLATLVAVPTVSRAVFVAAFVAVAAVRAPPPVTAAAVFSAVRVTDVVASDTVRGEADTTSFTVLGAPLAALLAVLTVSVNGLALRTVFVVLFVAVSTVRGAPFVTAAAVFSAERVSNVVASDAVRGAAETTPPALLSTVLVAPLAARVAALPVSATGLTLVAVPIAVSRMGDALPATVDMAPDGLINAVASDTAGTEASAGTPAGAVPSGRMEAGSAIRSPPSSAEVRAVMRKGIPSAPLKDNRASSQSRSGRGSSSSEEVRTVSSPTLSRSAARTAARLPGASCPGWRTLNPMPPFQALSKRSSGTLRLPYAGSARIARPACTPRKTTKWS